MEHFFNAKRRLFKRKGEKDVEKQNAWKEEKFIDVAVKKTGRPKKRKIDEITFINSMREQIEQFSTDNGLETYDVLKKLVTNCKETWKLNKGIVFFLLELYM